jgi:cytochrome c5
MVKIFMKAAIVVSGLLGVVSAFAQQPAATSNAGKTYQSSCESCHGAAMTYVAISGTAAVVAYAVPK